MLHLKKPPKRIKDEFWVWGHPIGSHNKEYNLPAPSTINPVDGADFLGIRNLFMVRYGNQPVSPYDDLAESLSCLNQVVWSLVGAGGRTNLEERQEVINLAKKFPNITGFIFDDFWRWGPEERKGIILSLEEMNELREQTKDYDLWSVCYVSELFREEIKPYLPLFDRHTLWTWEPFHLRTIDDKLNRFEDLIPDGKRYMGVYLWDYGGCKPMPLKLLKYQCERGLERIKKGKLTGMVFLATCLFDLDIEAVHWVKDWIREVGG